MPTINGKACVANGRNLISGSYDSSWGFNINGRDTTVQKVTMDSGEVALHVISSKWGFWKAFNLPSGDYTISVDVKGTGNVMALGWENISADGVTLTSDWQRVSRTASLDSKRSTFVLYGAMDVYVRFLKVEKGSVATPLTPAPVDKVFSNGRQIYVRNLFSVRDWEANNLLLTSEFYYMNIQLESNTEYTISTNIYRDSGVFDVFFFKDNEAPSSDTNGVNIGSPRTLTTSSTGNVKVAVRRHDLSDGIYWVKLEKGSIASPWTPAPEDVV